MENDISVDVNDSLESDEEEEEPKLKYEWILGDLQNILIKDGASCIYVNDKLLILGTNWGNIHVLDHQGNKIKHFKEHTGPVTMIDMDSSGDYIASCSHDRRVVVQGLYSNDTFHSFSTQIPVRCIAIEPNYGKARSNKRFIIGTNQVLMYEKKFFGSLKPIVLYENSGGSGEVIRNISWKGQFMAWAMDSAVKVMDMETKTVISLIKRDHSLALGCDQYPPHICWQNEYTLLIGWGDSVKVCRVRERTSESVKYTDLDLPPYYVEIVYMFVTDFYVCGIGPLDQLVVVLTYNKSTNIEGKKGDENSEEWRRPQMRVLQPLQGTYEELSKDVLAIKDYENYQPVNYHLEHLIDDRRFYVVCPQDVVVAKPREAHDRVKWLLEHERFQEALEVVENCGGKVSHYTVRNVGQTYIEHLIAHEHYKMAANLAPKILGNDKILWEEMVVRFNNINQLKHLSCHIPTGPPGPLLSTAIYQTILLDLLKSDHKTFLKVIQKWNKNLYNINLMIHDVLGVLAKESSNMVLLQALAHLYSNINKHDKALAIYLKLKHKDIFGLIRRHSLYWCVANHIVDLMTLDTSTALEICSQHIKVIDPSKVVAVLSQHEWFLYKYLDMLYSDQREFSFPFHNKLVKLYAVYDKTKIMPLLHVSSYIDLEPALNTVKSYGLIPETVYLLIRMGSNEAALRLVLEEEEDIHWAIKICKDHSDPDLWKILIRYSIDKPSYIRVLLNNIGTHVDPLIILRCIPNDMEIPGLRDSLTKIMHDYQLKISLQNGYQKILVGDGINLLQKQVASQRAAIPVGKDTECSICNLKMDLEVILFACRHVYHSKCLMNEQPDCDICFMCRNIKKMNVGS
ncbi:Vacuolar protein sorting-associated protein 41-like protein [Armadillidium nasatum]|uniref:Vacuolar protein sorting-associated protein 41-like protein n=1 Tax=Armadillidium nasatum TaxID=96803 RepID=A0A5N5TM43_9CRUS|nr:Vacuolar protein sorting-associated protein 41-like protein [Armadillidium nasatum]